MKLEELHKKLETEKSGERIIELLGVLNERDLTREEIVSSKLGVLVNQIRKRPENKVEVTKVAEKVLLKWKPLMTTGNNSGSTSITASPNLLSAGKRPLSEDEEEGKGIKTQTEEGKKTPAELKFVTKEEFEEVVKAFLPGSGTRDKCVEMLIRALMVDLLPENATGLCDANGRWALPDELTCSTAHAIEACLFHEFGGETSTEYKAKFRSKYMNLQNRQAGRHLRFGLLDGAIAPTKFCSMTPAVFPFL